MIKFNDSPGTFKRPNQTVEYELKLTENEMNDYKVYWFGGHV